MPITFTKYTVTANPKFTDEADKPDWSWQSDIDIKVNNLVLTNEECSDIVGFIAGKLLKHQDKMTGFSSTMTEQTLETKREKFVKTYTELLAKIEKLEDDEAPLVDIEEAREEIVQHGKKHPDWMPTITVTKVDSDYEQAVADLSPVFHEDHKCDDDEA